MPRPPFVTNTIPYSTLPSPQLRPYRVVSTVCVCVLCVMCGAIVDRPLDTTCCSTVWHCQPNAQQHGCYAVFTQAHPVSCSGARLASPCSICDICGPFWGSQKLGSVCYCLELYCCGCRRGPHMCVLVLLQHICSGCPELVVWSSRGRKPVLATRQACVKCEQPSCVQTKGHVTQQPETRLRLHLCAHRLACIPGIVAVAMTGLFRVSRLSMAASNKTPTCQHVYAAAQLCAHGLVQCNPLLCACLCVPMMLLCGTFICVLLRSTAAAVCMTRILATATSTSCLPAQLIP